MRLTSFFLVAATLFTVNVSLAQNAAPGSIRKEMQSIADKILSNLETNQQQNVEVGSFVPVGNSAANGGPGLRTELINALESKRKGCVTNNAFIAIHGTFLRVVDGKNSEGKEFIAERLDLKMTNKTTGDDIASIKALVKKSADIMSIEGGVMNVDPNLDTADLHQAMNKALKNPLTRLENSNTVIRSKEGSPYSLRIAVKPVEKANTGTPEFRPATLGSPAVGKSEGLPFVSIDKGEVYELYFQNDSDNEVGVSVKIDGISCFEFSEERNKETGAPKYSYFVVAKGGKLVLPGWHKTNDPHRHDNYMRFLVTEYGKGAASKMPQQAMGNIGVITVEVGESHLDSKHARSSAETGFGPPVKGSLEEVKRTIDPPHDFISVRYLR